VLRPFDERKTAFAATHVERVGSGRGVGGPDGTVDGDQHRPARTAAVVGRAVPLTFLLATVGVLLIAYTFVRLSQRFGHAGSVYGFVGATLGPRAGSVAGSLNAGTYLFYGVVTSTAAGIFINDLIRKLGLWPESPDGLGFVFAWCVLVVVWFMASREVNGGTRLLLVTEALTIALILIVMTITLVKLIAGRCRR
jgi:amino acid transporter